MKELNVWAGRPEFVQLLRAYARSTRLVREMNERFALSPEFLTEPASRKLCEMYLIARERVNSETQVNELLGVMMTLVAPIDDFFNDILVMHENKDLQNARLGLLQHIAELPKGIVDLTQVAGF